jgi:hypothetical protein
MADGPLNWTNTEAHVRCLHYGDWCLDLLGLKKLGNLCKECGLSGQKRSKKSTNRQQPVSSVNYRWDCDIIGTMHPKEKGRSKLQYALVVVDYYTGHCWTRSYHSKAETLSKFKEIMKQAPVRASSGGLLHRALLDQELPLKGRNSLEVQRNNETSKA